MQRQIKTNTKKCKLQTQRLAKNILQDLWYDYDDFCNLAARKDNLRNLEETFRYDELNRLTDISLNGVPTGHMAYDALGRMTDKRTDGQQVFASAQYETYDHAGHLKPHAMSGATMALRPFPTDSQNITYTMFDKVETISQSGNGPRMSLSYTYGHDRQRIHMEEKIGDYTLREKRYGDHCEIMTENRYTVSRTFLSGPLGVFAVVEHHGDGDEFHYVYKDHLGNWTTITDGAGNVEREQSFDAWGNPRNPDTWLNYPATAATAPMFDRGFTGHEHLTAFGLINMNGRVYDPVMSSFLSPDNYIQAPDFSQNFNRYAYCLNNPLRYTDPSGESIVLAAVVGAFWGAMINIAVNFNNIRADADFVNVTTLGALGGAVGGAAGFGAGTLATGLLASAEIYNPILVQGISGTASGFAGGFTGTSVTSWCTGATFGDGLLAGLKAGAISGAISGGIGAIQGSVQYGQCKYVFRRGCAQLGITPSDPVPLEFQNDAFLSDAQKIWFSEAKMKYAKKFTVENVPEDALKSMNQVDQNGNKAPALTRALKDRNSILTGNSNVYFNKDICFRSAQELYWTMAHELVHVSQYAALAGQPSSILDYISPSGAKWNYIMDYYAYSYELSLGNTNLQYMSSFSKDITNEFFLRFPDIIPKLNYVNYPWTQNTHFVYPF